MATTVQAPDSGQCCDVPPKRNILEELKSRRESMQKDIKKLDDIKRRMNNAGRSLR